MKRQCEVIIIGGSIAGSALAIALGRAGIDTVLCDKQSLADGKVCGEGLAPQGVRELARLGVWKGDDAQYGVPLSEYRIRNGAREIRIPLRSNLGETSGLGIKRSDLGRLLQNALAGTPVRIFTHTPVRKICREDDGVTIYGDERRWRAKWVVLADGVHSTVARDLGIPLYRSRLNKFSARFYLQLKKTHLCGYAQILLFRNYEVFITPVSETELNVNIMGDRARISRLVRYGLPLELTEWLEKKFGSISAGSHQAQGIGNVGTSVRGGMWQNMLLIGDCAESLDPIGGMGMTHALISARLCGRAIKSMFQEGCSREEAFKIYEKNRRQEITPYRRFTTLTELLLRKPLGFGALRMSAHLGLAAAVSVRLHQRRNAVTGCQYDSSLLR